MECVPSFSAMGAKFARDSMEVVVRVAKYLNETRCTVITQSYADRGHGRSPKEGAASCKASEF